MTSRLCNSSNPNVLKIKLLSPRVKETNGVDPFLVNKEPIHMSKLNGVVDVEDLQEATLEENFQVGAAYVFLRHASTGTWSQQAKIMPASAKPGDEFGGNVFLRENTLIVVTTEDDQSGDASGAVYHFYEKNGKWIEMQKFGYLDHECGLGCPYKTQKYQGLQFGFSIALQGNALIVAVIQKQRNYWMGLMGKSTFIRGFNLANLFFRSK